MRYSFHPEAETEFGHAIEYYEECEKNLGYDFAVEVYSAIERAVSYPKAWPIIEDEIRRALVKRFPYGILYSEETEEIFTQPTFWR
ncbi:hypothetical protein HKBW3S25_01234 [Candidatus Hakubella thermalkaliphila]|uniref:Uncharacterized protein n=1 Tax=Candidatus Hakubella thermalkaliphila TaxID=2754717 RepID=A0A6V8P0F9_9ACTN|nr:hypothetical protein HKBW3S25_01234 [Candidatus Hakubella thermalkaliphila]